MSALPDSSEPPQVTTDWVGLIDEWAYRFFPEMDYVAEAANAMQFQQEMSRLEGIVVPDVFPALTSHFVLTTAWIEGARRSAARLSHYFCRLQVPPSFDRTHTRSTAVYQVAAGDSAFAIEGFQQRRPCETSSLLDDALLTVITGSGRRREAERKSCIGRARAVHDAVERLPDPAAGDGAPPRGPAPRQPHPHVGRQDMHPRFRPDDRGERAP